MMQRRGDALGMSDGTMKWLRDMMRGMQDLRLADWACERLCEMERRAQGLCGPFRRGQRLYGVRRRR